MTELPAPLMPLGADLRNVPIPREAFARMAVAEFGLDYATAFAMADAAANRNENRPNRQVRRAQTRAQQ